MEYKIREDDSGYFTIYEIKVKNNLFFGSKVVEERMCINYLTKKEWFLNGQFKSEKECLDFLEFYKAEKNKIKVDKIISV
jgi:hypothetical protein